MTKSDEVATTETKIPSFHRRWALYFRHFPHEMLSFRFWRDMIAGKSPILWDGVMRYAERHPHCRFGNHTEDCRRYSAGDIKPEERRRPGLWRDDS